MDAKEWESRWGQEPLRESDMNYIVGVFGLRFTEGCSTGCVELYIEDDGWYHFKCCFDRLWLFSLEKVVQQALKTTDGGGV